MAPGPLQILIVVVLLLVVFGAGRMPFIAENLAKGIKSFKKGIRDDDDEPPKAVSDDSKNS